MKIQEIIELSQTIFQNNKEKGFWIEGQQKDVSDILSPLFEEFGECINADRKGLFVKRRKHQRNEHSFYNALRAYRYEEHPETRFTPHRFEKHIKNTLEDELADIQIRIMDLWGSQQFFTLKQVEEFLKLGNDPEVSNVVPFLLGKYQDKTSSFIYNLAKLLPYEEQLKVGEAQSLIALIQIFYAVMGFCEFQDIDIEWHIQEKLKYNKTRAFKHGKKY